MTDSKSLTQVLQKDRGRNDMENSNGTGATWANSKGIQHPWL